LRDYCTSVLDKLMKLCYHDERVGGLGRLIGSVEASAECRALPIDASPEEA